MSVNRTVTASYRLDAGGARRGEPIVAGRVFVDGKGVGDVGDVMLRDRRHLSEGGMILAVLGAFLRAVMRLLGFRKGTMPIAGEPHAHYFNCVTQYTIRPARGADAHDPYRPGLHHLCFRVATQADVDAVVAALQAIGVDATAPMTFPEQRYPLSDHTNRATVAHASDSQSRSR